MFLELRECKARSNSVYVFLFISAASPLFCCSESSFLDAGVVFSGDAGISAAGVGTRSGLAVSSFFGSSLTVSNFFGSSFLVSSLCASVLAVANFFGSSFLVSSLCASVLAVANFFGSSFLVSSLCVSVLAVASFLGSSFFAAVSFLAPPSLLLTSLALLFLQ